MWDSNVIKGKELPQTRKDASIPFGNVPAFCPFPVLWFSFSSSNQSWLGSNQQNMAKERGCIRSCSIRLRSILRRVSLLASRTHRLCWPGPRGRAKSGLLLAAHWELRPPVQQPTGSWKLRVSEEETLLCQASGEMQPWPTPWLRPWKGPSFEVLNGCGFRLQSLLHYYGMTDN